MGFFQEVKAHPYRTWKTIGLSLLFSTIGLHAAGFGPCLIDLSVQVDTTIDQITHILPLRAFGNMIGSSACGFALVYFDYQVVLLLSAFTMSVSFVFVPYCATLWQLYIAMMFNGLSAGFLVNAGNTDVLWKWGKESGSFMQLAHFCFGIGAFLSPFIIEPFLSEIADPEELSSTSGNSTDISRRPIISPDQLKIKWAFLIIGSLSFFICLLYLLTYLKKRDNKPHPTREVKEKKKKQNESVVQIEIKRTTDAEATVKSEKSLGLQLPLPVVQSLKKIEPYHKYVIVLLSAIFIHLSYGLELSFGVMLPSYARLSNLHLDKSNASFVTSLYWGCFTFFRLITMVLINLISARSMLIIDLALIMVGNVFLLPFGNQYEWALWVGSAFLGVSSIYPTLFCYLETILPVTSKMTSVINSMACIGEFIVPVLIGFYIKTNPDVFLYVVFLYSAVACVIFALSVTWEFVIKRHKNSSN